MFEIHWKHSINITQSCHKLNKYYDVSAPSIIVEEYYFTEFRWGRKGTNDTERSGHTIDVSTLMSTEKPMKLCWPMWDHECASAYDPGSHSHIESLTFLFWLRHLCKITQSAKSARRFATSGHTHNRVTPCNKCLELFTRSPNEFFLHFIIWTNQGFTTAYQSSTEWTPQRLKVRLSLNKVIPIRFKEHAVKFTLLTLEKKERLIAKITEFHWTGWKTIWKE